MQQQTRPTPGHCTASTKMPERLNLRITSWNARGISTRSRLAEIHTFIADHRPDIVFLQETFLNTNTPCYVPGYTVIRSDRTGHGGGLVNLIRHGIRFKTVNPFNLKAIEHIAIQINVGNEHITLTNVYLPKDSRSIKSDLKKLMSIENHFAFGDFNARHNSWSNNNNKVGNKLFDLLPFNGYVLLAPDEPTYTRPNGTSTIDFALTNTHHPIDPIVVNTDLISDHKAIETTIHCRFDMHTKMCRDYSKADWSKFKQLITDRLDQSIQIDSPQK